MQGPFPSLAPRPEEGLISVAEPVRPPVAVASDAALRAPDRGACASAAAPARALSTPLIPRPSRRRAASAPRGSDSWVAAQQAVSRLEAARGEATAALADLDRLSVDRADLPTNAEDYALIGAAMAEIERETAERQTRLDALRSRLNR